MIGFVVTSERGAEMILREKMHQFSHVVSIVDPNNRWTLDSGTRPKLELRFHDEEDPPRSGPTACTRDDIENLMDFFEHDVDEAEGVLIHCWAGCRRSAAAGFIFACMQLPACELDAVRLTNASAWMAMNRKHEFVMPRLNPNRRMVRLADLIYGQGGRWIAACERGWPRQP